MVRRVLINSSGMKVSKPGIDVIGASLLNLNFNSDWSALGLVQSGTYTPAWSGGVTSNVSQSFALVKTFPSPPFCAFFFARPGYLIPVGLGNGFSYAMYGNGTPQPRSCIAARVGNSSIQFSAMYNKNGNTGIPTPPFSVQFFVFDNNM